MTEFCRGIPADREDILDFINMVFSQNGVPHDFKALLPKLYGDGADTEGCHFLAKEDGRIRAAVGLFPTVLHVGRRSLRLGHIGSVSVHKYSRGKGYMKRLMEMALESAKTQGMDAVVLGGLKNRYQYFGFQPTGIHLRYEFIPENMSHQYKGEGKEEIAFVQLQSPKDELFSGLRAFYERRPLHMDRGDDAYFYRVLRSWEQEIYAVLKKGSLAGYLLCSPDHTLISEWDLKEKAELPAVIAAWFKQSLVPKVTIVCPPWEQQGCELLGRYCEHFVPEAGHSWNILNFRSVTEAFLCLKQEIEPLDAGELELTIRKQNGELESCRICCDGREIRVSGEACAVQAVCTGIVHDGQRASGSDAASDRRIVLDQLDAQEALFSEAVRWRNYGIAGGAAYKNWFPLPLYADEADMC